MAAEDTRLIAQLVVGRRVHCVSDDAVMALAKRVLELERIASIAIDQAAVAKRRLQSQEASE